MTRGKKNLSLFEAASIVAGLGVGGGIMAVPWLASLNGAVNIAAVMVFSYLLSLLLHLMITEMVMRGGEGTQLVELFNRYIFSGRGGAFFTWLFFILIVINFYALLAAFIVGGGEILLNLVGIPLWAGEILMYGVAAGVVFFGIKALGLSEKYAVTAIAFIVLALSLGSAGRFTWTLQAVTGDLRASLALYGMVMFSFACFFSIPQAVEGLGWNRKLVPRAVALGLGINFSLVLVITVMAVSVSESVTEVAIIGWGGAVGPWASIVGSLFVLLAILTSYWATSYALAVILEERLTWGYRLSWLAATVPTLAIALSGFTGFLGFMRMAGGVLAILVAVLVVPALRASRRMDPLKEGDFELGPWGGLPFQVLIIIAYILVVAGSIVTAG